MKTANTATKTIPVDAIDTTWTFTPNTAALAGHTFEATYSVARSGDVYVFAKVGDTPVRIHVGKDMPMYEACLKAAVAAKASPQQPATQAESQPVAQPAKQAEPKPAAKPAKAAKQPKASAEPAKPVNDPKPAAKPAKAAKQPKAEPKPAAEPAKPVTQDKPAVQPASQAEVDAKAWIGTIITGNGWRIVFDQATQRTRVCFDAAPSAKQKAAIETAGFYWSAQLQSWNKKLTCKAHRAALALAASLNALA